MGAYIFQGMFTEGVSKHFNVVAHLEHGPFGVATAKRNFPELEVYEDPESWPVADLKKQNIKLVFANPPCAPWSQANGKSFHGWKDDPRVSCVHRTFALLKDLRPDVWTFESVRGAYAKGREMCDALALEANKLGYRVTHLLTDGVDCGIAQSRRRYFFVAHKVRINWTPTNKPLVTVKEAIGHMTKLRPDDVLNEMPDRLKGTIKKTKQGEVLRKVYDREHGIDPDSTSVDRGGPIKGRPGFLITRLAWDRQAPTITGSATKIHPTEDRFITIRETKALCGLPESFEFVGKMSDQYAQIAKAVMPRTAEYFAGRVAEAIERKAPAKVGVCEVTVYRDRIEQKEVK